MFSLLGGIKEGRKDLLRLLPQYLCFHSHLFFTTCESVQNLPAYVGETT